jgi:hypothetical protein
VRRIGAMHSLQLALEFIERVAENGGKRRFLYGDGGPYVGYKDAVNGASTRAICTLRQSLRPSRATDSDGILGASGQKEPMQQRCWGQGNALPSW